MTIRWSDEHLDHLAGRTDPGAEEAVRALLHDAQPLALRELLRALTHNDDLVPDELPAPLHDWLVSSAELPSWADPVRIAKGEEVFARYGLQVLQHLLYCGLPACYVMGDTASVLGASRQLDVLTRQRVLETLSWVLKVMEPGALAPGGSGLRAVQKVRLLHAAIRVHLEEQGVDLGGLRPINQEELALVLVTFSVMAVRSLRRYGAELDEEEIDAFLHAWRVIGHHLGIEDDAILLNEEDGWELWAAGWRRHAAATPEGQALMGHLLGFMDEMLPGRWLDGIGPVMVRHLAGDEMSDMLGLPAPDWTTWILAAYRLFVDANDELQDLGVIPQTLMGAMGRAFLRSLHGTTRTGGRPPFDIPLTLREHWGVERLS